MQCAACLEVYPDVLDACPYCPDSETDAPPPAADASAMTQDSNASTQTTQAPQSSTLIEFPGVNRNRPAWRKELSERFREIQQRRAREAALEAEAEMLRAALDPGTLEGFADAAPREAEATKQLGLVPPPDEPEPNPILARALRRLERARQQAAPSPPVPRAGSGRGHAATAAARVYDECPLEDAESLPAPASRATEKPEKVERPAATGPVRPTNFLVVHQNPAAEMKASPAATSQTVTTPEVAPVPAHPEVEAKVESRVEAKTATKVEAKIETKVETRAAPKPAKAATVTSEVAAVTEAKPQPRKISGVIDEHWLERHGVGLLPSVETGEAGYDDRAPRLQRLAAGLFDLLVVAFLCAPFAAVIELTIGDWSEPRVMGSMGGIVFLVMFLYHTCSVALASRTFGMKLFRLHTVDAGTARVPTTWQCARRALAYIVSLAAFGLGILYALVDAEGRTAHDLLSGTVVVKE